MDGTALESFIPPEEVRGPAVTGIYVDGSDWELHYSVDGYRIEGVRVMGMLDDGGETDVTGLVTFSSDSESVTVSYGGFSAALPIEHDAALEIHIDPETIFYDFFMPDEFPADNVFTGWKEAGEDQTVLPFPIVNRSRDEEIVITPAYHALEEVFEMSGSVITAVKGELYEFYGIPSSVTGIASGVFRRNSTVKAVAFERDASITAIESDTFYLSSLEYIEIPASVTEIKARAFDGASHLKEVIFEENSSLEIIGPDAFSVLTMREFVVPRSVREIGRSAFGMDVYLENVIFEDGTMIERIDPYAFDNDYSLQRIEFVNPSSSFVPDGAETGWGAPFEPRIIWNGYVI